MSVDGSNGCIGSFMKLKREKYPKLGILLSIGGASGSAPFPSITADDGKLRAFCESVGTFIRHHGFDGVDSMSYTTGRFFSFGPVD
jgi:GH18 family chitinase